MTNDASGAKATVEKDLPFVMSCAVLAIAGGFVKSKMFIGVYFPGGIGIDPGNT